MGGIQLRSIYLMDPPPSLVSVTGEEEQVGKNTGAIRTKCIPAFNSSVSQFYEVRIGTNGKTYAMPKHD